MRFCLNFLFSFFIIATAFSQRSTCHKFIPYFHTLNAEKLAYKLTHNLKDDSSKVYAIHCWITHHIKYDVKKSELFDYRRHSIKKILRKRKAICTGYSDLFNELCRYANITSTYIPGYIKNEHVDLNDRFYLDEHVWNAVFINDEWKLIDACWDAGYIKYYKRTPVGKIVYFLSSGKKDKIKFKTHFVRYPTNTYYFKNGAEFIIDHIPSNPIWQLIDPIETIENCEDDSSFYFKSKKAKEGTMLNSGFSKERQRVSEMTQKERDIYNGPDSYAFNYKNHYNIGISEFIIALDLYNKTDTKSKDSIAMIMHCDKVLSKLNTTRSHFDSTVFYLKRQSAELKTKNQLKKDILTTQNKSLISSTRKVERTLMSGKRIALETKRTINNLNKMNKARLKKLNGSKRFEKAKSLRFYSTVDSINSVRKTEQIYDSLLLINSKIKGQFLILDSLYHLYLKRFEKYSQGSISYTSVTKSISFTRLNYFDDLDYEIRPGKDSLFKYKFNNDALLFEPDNVFVMKSFSRELAKLKTDFRKLYNYHRILANELVKLKKYHADQNTLSLLYKSNLNNYSYELNKYKFSLLHELEHFYNLKKHCKKQLKNCKAESKSYVSERYIEMKMFSLRGNYISSHHNALVQLSNRKINEINRKKGKIELIRSKYSKNKI